MDVPELFGLRSKSLLDFLQNGEISFEKMKQHGIELETLTEAKELNSSFPTVENYKKWGNQPMKEWMPVQSSDLDRNNKTRILNPGSGFEWKLIRL